MKILHLEEGKRKKTLSLGGGQETICGPRYLMFSTDAGGAGLLGKLYPRDLETQSLPNTDIELVQERIATTPTIQPSSKK